MKKPIIAAAIIIVLAIASWLAIKQYQSTQGGGLTIKETKALADPRKVTSSFYNEWVSTVRSTTTDPYTAGLLNKDVISPELRTDIEQKHTAMKKDDQDPVTCQVKSPKRVTTKLVYATSTDAQVLVFFQTATEKLPVQAMATLKLVESGWQIQKINCSNGDIAPVAEFDFEQTGSLLKESAQAPLDPKNIYLVYKQENQPDSTVQLFFNTTSLCIAKDKTQKVCVPAQLTEGTNVLIQAGVTEEGAVVKKLTVQ